MNHLHSLKFLSFTRSSVLCILICIFLTGLLFSKTLLSIAVALIAAHWLFDKHIPTKFRTIIVNKPLLLILGIYILHIIGCLYSSNLSYALKDIRIKLPLLVLPLVLASEHLSHQDIRKIKNWFYLNLLAASLLTITLYMLNPSGETRKLFPFMNHIRFSMTLSIGFFLLMLDVIAERKFFKWKSAIAFIILFTLLFIVSSFNGLMVFFATALVMSFYLALQRSVKAFAIISISTFLIAIIIGTYTYRLYHKLFSPPENFHVQFLTMTKAGNTYEHLYPHIPLLENGMPVFVNVCETELHEQWNRRSSIPYDSTALNGYPLKEVLLRYLTSLNLTKDSAGIWSITEQDIMAIERGIPNKNLVDRSNLARRFYEIVQSYKLYQQTGDPNDKTIFMRLEYWRAAMGIIKRYPLFGVGTGDVPDAFREQYSLMNTKLHERWWLRSHNQYLTIAVAFGISGLLLFLSALILPPISLRTFRSPYFIAVFSVLMVSMLTEDTLETQQGVSLFAFFFNFFLFQKNHLRATSENKQMFPF